MFQKWRIKLLIYLIKKYGLPLIPSTSALMLGLLKQLKFQKDLEIITAAFTFATTVTPILKNDFIPVFMDAEKDTLNIDANN